MMIGLMMIGTGLISSSSAGDASADIYCCFSAGSLDARVIVWHVDRRGNKGYRIWEGIIRKGDRKLIRTFDGRIRYAVSRNIDGNVAYSGDKSRWCDKGQVIGVP